MKNTTILSLILAVFVSIAPFASAMNNPTLPVNEPVIGAVTSTTVEVSVSPQMLNTLSDVQKSQLYFEYIPSQQVCIMIYPTPESCLPKKTPRGQTSVVLQNLKSSTSYNIYFKVDNTIACITTPCPSNELRSNTVEFTTLSMGTGLIYFSHNLWFGSRGSDVVMLQNILKNQGYMTASSTGYFGLATHRGVKSFQKNYMHIAPTGFVGSRTREALNNLKGSIVLNSEEHFSGVIQSVSTGCYSDGECSVTIDGKKVVTTLGWSQAIVGSIKGTVNNIGDIQNSKIGAQANVYAKRTTDGYTLYGSSDYYIEVL